MLFPYCPLQSSFSATMSDGIIATELEGGAPYTRRDVYGAPHVVQATWVLHENDYSIFMAYWRQWIRSGGAFFEIDMILESQNVDRYQASFIPGTMAPAGKNGSVFTINAPLWVLPLDLYIDEDTDPFLAFFPLIELYGDITTVLRMLNLLEKLVNVDLPHE